MEEASNGERKRETQREEGGVVFSDVGFCFSITSFSKSWGGEVVLFCFMSVIYSNKNKSTKNWGKQINFKIKNFLNILR